jgi:hypothetical protein
MVRSFRAFFLVAAVATTLLTGCRMQYIPNTDVEDSDDNRQVITFCEKYRHAVELKDVPELLQLASNEYYEDGGNVDASDDLDFAGLREYLTTKFDSAHAIRYEMRYRRIIRQTVSAGDPGTDNNGIDRKAQGAKNDAASTTAELIYVDYTYSASYRIQGVKGGDEWRRKVEDNRLEILHFPDNSYRIVAGM